MSQPALTTEARRLLTTLKPAWGRVEALMQEVRCDVQYFGNLQG